MQLCPWAYIWSRGSHSTTAALRRYHNGGGPWKHKPFTPWPSTEKVCGSPGSAGGKEPTCQCRSHRGRGFNLWVGKISWRRVWQPTRYSCLENPMDRGAWRATGHGATQSDTTEVTQHAAWSRSQAWVGQVLWGGLAGSWLILEPHLVLPLQLSEQLPWWVTAPGWEAEWALKFPFRSLASHISQGLGVPEDSLQWTFTPSSHVAVLPNGEYYFFFFNLIFPYPTQHQEMQALAPGKSAFKWTQTPPWSIPTQSECWLVSLWLLLYLSMLSYVCWPSVCLLQRNVSLALLPIFWLGCLLFCYWAAWDTLWWGGKSVAVEPEAGLDRSAGHSAIIYRAYLTPWHQQFYKESSLYLTF